jgi:hypothetical protein
LIQSALLRGQLKQLSTTSAGSKTLDALAMDQWMDRWMGGWMEEEEDEEGQRERSRLRVAELNRHCRCVAAWSKASLARRRFKLA